MADTTDMATTFRHEALLYAGEEEFVRRTSAFVEEGLDAREAVLVVVGAQKIARLREHLGLRAGAVLFADMAEIGRNPARIIPAWRDFVAESSESGRGFRGVGEPIDASRDPAALVECERHEALLNVAFHGSPPWSLLCPYDTELLPAEVVDQALRNHPYLRNGGSRPNPRYQGLHSCAAPLETPLPDPPGDATRFRFGPGELADVRARVAQHATVHGLGRQETQDLVLAVHELVTNSIRHGGGGGVLRLWSDDGEIVAEIRDAGRIADPLAGRVEPSLDAPGGRGLWLANQLCDLVQIRSRPDGGTVRVRVCG